MLEGRRQQIEAKVLRNRGEREESLQRREELLQALEAEQERRRRERERDEEQRTARAQELHAQVHTHTRALGYSGSLYETNGILWPTPRFTYSYSDHYLIDK